MTCQATSNCNQLQWPFNERGPLAGTRALVWRPTTMPIYAIKKAPVAQTKATPAPNVIEFPGASSQDGDIGAQSKVHTALAAALKYHERGWWTIPVPFGKQRCQIGRRLRSTPRPCPVTATRPAESHTIDLTKAAKNARRSGV